MQNIKSIILENLAEIEKKHDVRILYAVESGSRAWGFASKDSDYDVRFIYAHPLEWYLSIADKRDVIEVPITDELDISGWDLRKALGLFRKSNPPMLEWLRSPIVYLEKYQTAESLRKLSKEFFMPKRVNHHYLHMAEGNFREYLKGEMVRVKKYFYVLRPVLACMWIENKCEMAPTEFSRLFREQPVDTKIVAIIENLLKKKIKGVEMDISPRIEPLNAFLDDKITYYSEISRSISKDTLMPIAPLDSLFIETIREVY
jgi:predicted nucleotidyltransferase